MTPRHYAPTKPERAQAALVSIRVSRVNADAYSSRNPAATVGRINLNVRGLQMRRRLAGEPK
jgi:hypothetical protein